MVMVIRVAEFRQREELNTITEPGEILRRTIHRTIIEAALSKTGRAVGPHPAIPTIRITQPTRHPEAAATALPGPAEVQVQAAEPTVEAEAEINCNSNFQPT
jgi:hypothetical protein